MARMKVSKQDREAELVVIGGGGSGLAAALSASEKGLKKIIVLEKRNAPGGNTAQATGLFGCESPTQSREHIIADTDTLFKKAMAWAKWRRINPRIFRAFLEKSGDTIRWLEEKGLEFTVIAFFPNQEPRVEHVAKGKGAELTRVLAQQCRDRGIEIMLHTGGTKIYRGKKGSVTGVAAAGDNEEFEINTKSVIVATGGFSGNNELLKKYCQEYYDGFGVRGLPLNGDGLLMAQEAGAAIEDFVTLLKEGPRLDLRIWPLGGCERDPLTLWVNNRGERFVDEAVGMHPFEAVNAILQQPGKVIYSLMDTAVKDKLTETFPALNNAFQAEAAKGRVKTADSWTDIAAWIGGTSKALKASIEQYNDFCTHGRDAIFAKEPRYLMALCKPPYYAIRCYPHILDTIGGIRINERMEVLDKQDKPIQGLYAAGVAASGWEGETYCSDLSGSAFGFAINSGRIAGENAAEFISVNK